MGLYKQAVAVGNLASIADAKSYTMYERSSGIWYVNFRHGDRQQRYSLNTKDRAEALGIVESFRRNDTSSCVGREVDQKHLRKMIERARYKHRNKGVPFGLTMDGLRKVAARCGGYCEVSGHQLENDGPFRPSLDRIDPARGYVLDNVRIVCLITNTAMLHYGEAALFELAITLCNKRGFTNLSLPQPQLCGPAQDAHIAP